MKLKYFIAIIVITAVLGFFGMVQIHASHHVPDPVCGEGEHVGNPHCITTTPTPTQGVTPTVTPGITLTPTPTGNPGCDGDCEEVTPTLTPSPTAGVSATPTPEVTESSTTGDSHPDELGCANHDCNTHKNDAPPATSPFD